MSAKLRVTLADVPTDVLVYLVDHGPATSADIARAVAPPDALDLVRSALFLLIEGGWAETPDVHDRFCATGGGCAAVAKARTEAGAE